MLPRFAPCLLLLLTSPLIARAATIDTTLTGTSLAIGSPCARHVDIQPDAALHDQIVVNAKADHQEELDRLLLQSKATARIGTRSNHDEDDCWKPDNGDNFTPTLDLAIRVPAGFALSVEESGAARYAIGPVGGKLDLDISGSVDLRDDAAAHLSVELSGNGTVAIGKLTGDAAISLSGHGKTSVDQAALGKLSVELSGAGEVAIAHGSIADATIDASGAGAINLQAEVNDAHVDLSGVASVHFAKVTGSMDKDVSGAGSVSVGN